MSEKKQYSLIRSTGIVAISTLASRIFGFIRDMLTAQFFGASGSLDGFFVAFRIPNLFRRLTAEGAFSVSFIPVYTDYLVNRGEKEALELAQKALTALSFFLIIIVGLGVVFSPYIVDVIAFGFKHPDKISLTVSLNRIMFPYLFFVSIVAFCMGILNSHNYFFAPAFSPVLLNVGIIIGILFFRNFFEEPLYGMAYGVIFGGILQLLLQIPYLVKSGFRLKISLDLSHPGVRKIGALMLPLMLGTAIYQINIFMSTFLASFLPDGSISYLYYSDRLTEIVLGVFIVSIGNVILPSMSKLSATNDLKSLNAMFTTSLRSSLYLALPSSAALMTIGYPIVSVLFMRQRFTHFDAVMTERALFYSSIGLAAIAALRITTPVYYALKDTRTPVLTSFLSFVINIACGYFLMQTGLKHAGLSLANSIAVAIQILILFILLYRKIGFIIPNNFVNSIIGILVSSLIMGIILWVLSSLLNWHHPSFIYRASLLVMLMCVGGAIYFICTYYLKIPETLYVVNRFKSLLFPQTNRT
ncbi:MAG: murein biosynthesis integral membrane protein MurJ [Spirochaetes bacterium]|nr:murein biosynthesis integral membrane protein MurJ [Spirochaetota bacterium]